MSWWGCHVDFEEAERWNQDEDSRSERKIERFGRLFSAFGFAAAWIVPNLTSAFCIAMGTLARLLMLYMITHGGYHRVPPMAVARTLGTGAGAVVLLCVLPT